MEIIIKGNGSLARCMVEEFLLKSTGQENKDSGSMVSLHKIQIDNFDNIHIFINI